MSLLPSRRPIWTNQDIEDLLKAPPPPPFIPYTPSIKGKKEAEKVDPNLLASIRVEKIDNGYLIFYTRPGATHAEGRRFASDMKEVGEAVIAACTKLELQGK